MNDHERAEAIVAAAIGRVPADDAPVVGPFPRRPNTRVRRTKIDGKWVTRASDEIRKAKVIRDVKADLAIHDLATERVCARCKQWRPHGDYVSSNALTDAGSLCGECLLQLAERALHPPPPAKRRRLPNRIPRGPKPKRAKQPRPAPDHPLLPVETRGRKIVGRPVELKRFN